MRVVCDLEADGLQPTRIWCIVAIDIDTGIEYVFDYNMQDFAAFAADVTEWIGHNFLIYDRKALRLIGTEISARKITDTLILSRLFNPVRQQNHSLARWGRQFGVQKPKHEDFSKYTPEMLHRCKEDCKITLLTYNYLMNEGKDFSQRSIRLEHNRALILDSMHQKGWKLDVEKATQLYQECVAKVQEITLSFGTDEWPCLPRSKRLVSFGRRQDGVPMQRCTKQLSSTHEPWGDYTLVQWRPFNPNSTTVVTAFLDYFGWKPTEKTKAGNYKVSEENIATLSPSAPAAAHKIKEYLILSSRANMIKNWMDNTWDDDRVHGKILCPAAKTHRGTHRDPNMANVPGVLDRQGRTALYGKECRECWTVEPGRALVGVDASGIQLRILAHIANDPAYTKIVCTDKKHGLDVHTYHSKILGSTREVAKTFIYAWVLNAQATRIGLILGCSKTKAQATMNKFLKLNPQLAKVKEFAKRCAQRGYYKASDGRRIEIPSEHQSLACILQGEESIIMGEAGILWQKEINDEELDAFIVGWVHDEYQIDCALTCAKRCGTIMVEKIILAGKRLNLRVPLDGESKVGTTWCDTH